MARAVTARQHGDIYQARAFWSKACRLFRHYTKVAKVGYEVREVPHFDDVAVMYKSGVLDSRGEPLSADYYQIKWHTDQSRSVTCDSLTDPKFLGSKRTSLLQRLKKAVEAASVLGQDARFNFVTTWGVKSDDPLGKLVSGADGEIRLDVLFNASNGSQMGRVREKWAEHLAVETEALRSILSRLRLCLNSANLSGLSKEISDRMAEVGLETVEFGRRTNPYDGLIMRLSAEGRTYFSRRDIQEICETEGLWKGTGTGYDPVPVVGVRSFRRFTDHLEDETVHLLDLLHLFEGRQIRSHDLWSSEVTPSVREFAEDKVVPMHNCRIHLDCHGSIAFTTGYELDPKSGVVVAPYQRTANGRQIWALNTNTSEDMQTGWQQSEVLMNSKGVEDGVCLSVTHSISEDVKVYAKERIPRLGRLLNLSIEPDIGPISVRDGQHAWSLAEKAIRMIRSWRGHTPRAGPLHVFFAAPNGLVFFLGRLSRSLGPVQLYEHDFESGTPGAYRPALSLPISRP